MVLFFQYTICDTRILGHNQDWRLDKPNWALTNPNKHEWVCGSGRLIRRIGGGLNNWVGENCICKINKGIQFATSMLVADKLKVIPTGKHQFSDGTFLHKYEFVFHVKSLQKTNITKLTLKDLHLIINTVLEHKVKIRKLKNDFDEVSLGKFLDQLKTFHINCTTENKAIETQDYRKISICNPQVFIRLNAKEQVSGKLPRTVMEAEADATVPCKLLCWFDDGERTSINRFWLLQPTQNLDKKAKSAVRKIRIACMRLHSEMQVINRVLDRIPSLKIAPYSVDSLLIQDYLNEALKRIKRSKKSIAKLSDIDFIDQYIKKVHSEFEPNELKTYESQLKKQIRRIKALDFKPNITKTVINYIQEQNNNILDGYGNIYFYNNKNTNKMTAFELSKKALSIIVPFLKTEVGKEIAGDVGETLSNEGKLLWRKIKPIFIKEEFVPELEKDPTNEDAQDDLQYKLKLKLKEDEAFMKEILAIIEKPSSQPGQTVNNFEHNGTGDNKNIQGDDKSTTYFGVQPKQKGQ